MKARVVEGWKRPSAMTATARVRRWQAARVHLLAHGPRGHQRDADAVLDHELDEVGVVGFEREVGAEVDALEEGVGRAADGRALLEEDEAGAAHIGDRD